MTFPLRRTLTFLAAAALIFTALAHKPVFPEGAGPFEVERPAVSQAYYLRLEPGQSHTFVVPALAQTVPVQLLVLDDELGRSLALVARWRCGASARGLTQVDQPFFEAFSGLEHRYRVLDQVGPTEAPCEVEVWEQAGRAGPYVFAIGFEERFGFGDIVGLLGLGRKLDAWQRP